MKKINVISLFNGMNTLRQALENKGFSVGKYYSSEIKPYAIELTQHHFEDTIQVGDVTKWREWDIDWASIDFIGSGSPCQDLSIAGNRKGLEGSRSSLFWVFIEILEHVKKLNPNVLFLQENVGSAPRKDVGIMSRALGVYPVRINSKLVTAQLRDRYYWTNIRTKPDGIFGDIVSDIPQPKDRNVMFKDIIENGFIDKCKCGALLQGDVKQLINDPEKQDIYLRSRIKKGKQLPPIVFTPKAYTLLESESRAEKGISLIKRNAKGMRNLILENNNVRTLTKTELCRLQGFPDNYCDILTRNKAASLLGDGWTLPIIEHILSFVSAKQTVAII